MKKLIFLVILTIGLLSCSNKNDPNYEEVNQFLQLFENSKFENFDGISNILTQIEFEEYHQSSETDYGVVYIKQPNTWKWLSYDFKEDCYFMTYSNPEMPGVSWFRPHKLVDPDNIPLSNGDYAAPTILHRLEQ